MALILLERRLAEFTPGSPYLFTKASPPIAINDSLEVASARYFFVSEDGGGGLECSLLILRNFQTHLHYICFLVSYVVIIEEFSETVAELGLLLAIPLFKGPT